MKTSARIAGVFVALVAGVLLAVAPATAQVLYGTVVGTVTDPTGAAIPKASVTVVNTATGLSRQVTTDETGYFSVPNLLQGTYDITVSASGFKPFTRRGVSVLTNTVTRVDATLEVGAITESITVEATAALLQTTKTDVSVNLEPRALVNLPLAAYRNYQMLINLVPGATPARFQNAVIDTPGRALTTNINGQERGANNTRLDGAANILVTMPHHVVYVPPVESIQEVNISTNSFEAEQGMTGGAAVTVVTKSGTNEFHGSLFGMHQDNAMRAFLWDERRVGVTRKPKNIRNILGGSLGGPIKKNQWFFFGDWEGVFERVGRSLLLSVFPADYRQGDFTRKLGAPIFDAAGRPIMVPTTEGGSTQLRDGMIFDPYTGNPDGTGRAVFSYNGRINVIPPNRLNPAMKKLLDLVPMPNQPGDLNNFFNSGTQVLNRNNADVKINWNRRDRHQLWYKYSVMNALVTADASLGKAGGPPLSDGGLGRGHTLVQLAAIGQTYTVSPTFLVDGVLGWTRFGQDVQQPDLQTKFGLDVLGIPGTNGPDWREGGMPRFDISGYTSLGYTETWNPLFRNDQSVTFNGNANWMKGVHEVRFGVDYLHHLMNHWQPELGGGPRGVFGFGSAITALNPSALRSTVGFQGPTPSFEREWNAVAAFLLGVPSSAAKSPQYIKMTSFENQYALYVRDRWRVTPKLTLNLGLRWELYPTRTRAAGMGIESYDPETNEVLIGGRGGIPRDVGVGYSKKLFAPRVWLRLPAHQIHGDPQRLRDHLRSQAVGRAGAARLVPAEHRRHFLGSERLPAGDHRPQLRRRGHPAQASGAASRYPPSCPGPTSARAAFLCLPPQKWVIRWLTRRSPAATSSPGISSSSASCRARSWPRSATSVLRRSTALPSWTSTLRKFLDRATTADLCIRNSGAPQPPANSTGARIAFTTRCKWRSTGASRAACS
jgi:hypothetical protein